MKAIERRLIHDNQIYIRVAREGNIPPMIDNFKFSFTDFCLFCMWVQTLYPVKTKLCDEKGLFVTGVSIISVEGIIYQNLLIL